ncbi:hypothetical protein [Ktedonosporobacter rubrisoli]|nr:hypothetical protein [Ktedonosporobacter rubrisoli]
MSQHYTANEAPLYLEALDDHAIRPLLLEQPVHFAYICSGLQP